MSNYIRLHENISILTYNYSNHVSRDKLLDELSGHIECLNEIIKLAQALTDYENENSNLYDDVDWYELTDNIIDCFLTTNNSDYSQSVIIGIHKTVKH